MTIWNASFILAGIFFRQTFFTFLQNIYNYEK
jgi:hypothetical protein